MEEDRAGASHRKIWYVVNDPASREYNGPYSVTDIVQMVEDGRLKMEASWAFKKEDTSMVPVKSIPGVERRQPRDNINIPIPKVGSSKLDAESWWYCLSGENPVGPLTIVDLRKELVVGKINRETPVWKLGSDKWIFLFQVKDFDRRGGRDH